MCLAFDLESLIAYFWGVEQNVSECFFLKAWKSADLTTGQKEATDWKLSLGLNIDRNDLKMAIIRNQGQLLGNPTTPYTGNTVYNIRFENDIRPEQTLTIELWHFC